MPLTQQQKDYHREYKRKWRLENKDVDTTINRKHSKKQYAWRKISHIFLNILL